ncbi:MAG TPA: Uma2 family endonuclease [Candidatus Xenobia bacterium]|jgi:Uma2 family endonuclease
MTVRASSLPGSAVVTHTDWEGYLKILDALDGSHLKITYDRGVLELLSPSNLHEKVKTIIGALVECLLEEFDRYGSGGGSTTFRREHLEKGLEPDECYFLAPFEDDGDEVPAPQLAIEVDVTSSSLDRMGIYATLGVGEVWRWETAGEGRLVVYLLTQPGVYQASAVSRVFPDVPMDVLPEYVRLGLKTHQIKAVQQFRAWVRQTLRPEGSPPAEH